jgi:hypothetical protein
MEVKWAREMVLEWRIELMLALEWIQGVELPLLLDWGWNLCWCSSSCKMGVQVGMVKLGWSKGGQVGVLREFHVFHPHPVKLNLVGEVCGEVYWNLGWLSWCIHLPEWIPLTWWGGLLHKRMET